LLEFGIGTGEAWFGGGGRGNAILLEIRVPGIGEFAGFDTLVRGGSAV
jgi:hypothetical protein